MKRDRTRTILEEFLLLICTIIIVIPLYYLLISAFKARGDIIQHPLQISKAMFTLKNFPYVIKKMKYWKALKNTAIMTGTSLLIVIICASLAGFAISRVKNRVFNGYYRLLVTLMVIPFIGCLLPLTTQSVKIGTYNSLWGVILIQAAWNLPFSIFLYTGFMQGISKELEEAAYIDGCSTFGVYWRIFLPLLAPVTATCCIRQGVGIWNDFLVSSSLLNGNKTPTLMVGINSFFGERVTEFGYAFAGILLCSLPMIIVFLCLQKYFIKGITAGSVKG